MGNFQTKKQIATERLRHAIRSGRYALGQPLRQNDIATDLGLSSTPVREALAELAVSGLVVYEEHRGARVTTLDIARVEQVYAARRLIEREAAKLAFRNIGPADIKTLDRLCADMTQALAREDFEALAHADEAFHDHIRNACGNPYLVSAVEHLMHSFPRYFIWNIGGRMKQSMREHREMVQALKTKDRTRFVQAVTDHLDHSLQTVRDHFDQIWETEEHV